jgi:triacylglycerol lipase
MISQVNIRNRFQLSDWRDCIEMMAPPLPWDRPQWNPRKGPPVVLLHGLWRSWRAMQPIARALEKEQFSTLNLPYPSSRRSIEHLVAYVREQVAQIPTDEPIHFITHSLGGIVARTLLAEDVPWKRGKLLMLAPPNQGSEIVDWLKKIPILHLALGPAGRALGTNGIPNRLPPLPSDIETAVIMGCRCSIPVFGKLLDPINDGIVSAAKGKIEGLQAFSIIDADHTFIQKHPEAIRRILEFLKTGNWID